MPANTPVLALPYPLPADTVDVPRDMQALAVKLDTLPINPPLVTSLPGSPADGQEVYYQADATNGVVWHLRYRAASASAYKWEYVGGPPLSSEFMAQETFNSMAQNVWAGVSANDPKLTAPLAGDYDAQHVASVNLSAANTVCIGLRVGATEPGVGTNAANATVSSGAWASMSQRRRLAAVPASTVIQQRYLHTAAAAANLSRLSAALTVWPVRVG